MTVIEALSVDQTARISAQARQWGFGRTMLGLARVLLSAVAWLLVGAGRVAHLLVAGVWLATTWCAAAVKVGWDDAHGSRDEASG